MALSECVICGDEIYKWQDNKHFCIRCIQHRYYIRHKKLKKEREIEKQKRTDKEYKLWVSQGGKPNEL